MTGGENDEELRELVGDLCLKTDGKITKEDHDAVVNWLQKVREMYMDIESRRNDAREAAVEAVRRLETTWQLFKDLEPKMVVNDEQIFRELKDRFGSAYGFGVYFQGGMGAESIRELLKGLDLNAEAANLRETIRTSKGQKQARAIKRLKVVNAFIKSENKPEWMVLDAVPVIPPELRPMVQLDGGRFATSDLNDLYRRVINRNNRLKRLLDLGAPEIIVNNEKRMLQEAVDALFDNGRRGRAVTGPGNRPLKSLSDMLKGKQGRFRQNLLGKRVDYSGRSVIVAGPYLKLHQCGLPKLMALELFKPFIMSRLVERKSVQNIKAAKKYVDSMTPEVWDVLEEVIAEHPVLLNRAPTLHRLGIQAFEPVLVEGKAIQVHPLVCHAFNADFDGDQMAVHLPLSAEAQAEARILMLSSNNILSPAHGRPLATPTQDMILGGYFLTYSVQIDGKDVSQLDASKLKPADKPRRFGSENEVVMAVESKQVELQQPIEYRHFGELMVTTPGRVIFNAAVERALTEAHRGEAKPVQHVFINRTLSKKEMDGLITELSDRHGAASLAAVLDAIKTLGFKYATQAGVTISKNDIVIPREKEQILAEYEKRVSEVEAQYERGLITEEERHESIVNIWTEGTDVVADAMEKTLYELNPIFMMANSGARGSFKQIRQLAGMRGLMANPKGEIIERPIKANFMEGLSVLEYFISTHGARKGLADTALRTADSGYLTRRLVDVSQDVIIRDKDCKSDEWIDLPLYLPEGLNRSLLGRVIAAGRLQAARQRQAREDEAAREGRSARQPDAAGVPRRDRGGRVRDAAGPLGAQVQERVRRVPGLLRHLPRHRRDVRGRRRGRHHRRAVDRRAGHPADHADVPHRRRRRRGHHARPPARRRDLRGPQPEGCGPPRGDRRQGHRRGDRARPEGDHRPDDDRRGRGAEGVPAPAPHAAARQDGRRRPAGRPAARGLAQPDRRARAALRGRPWLDADRAVPRPRGAEGLQVAGRRHPRQAHRADRPADAEEGPDRHLGRDRLPARPDGRQGRARAREQAGEEGEGRAGRRSSR